MELTIHKRAAPDFNAKQRQQYVGCIGLAAIVLRELKLPSVFHRIGSMFCLFFTSDPVTDLATAKRSDLEKFARYFRACLERGVYFAPRRLSRG